MKKFIFVILVVAIFIASCSYVIDYIESKSADIIKGTDAPETTSRNNDNTDRITPSSADETTPTITPTAASTKEPENTPEPTPTPVLEAGGFINIKVLDPRIIVELRYATTNNFTSDIVYDYTIGILRKTTAQKLAKVSEDVAKDGYRLKIWDAYRTPAASWKLWEGVKDPKYVSNPDLKDKHCKGAAVDLTLVDSEGNELLMPTGFDTFTEDASGKYATGKAYENWQYLKKVMEKNGFLSISSEWWHYNDSEVSKYDVIDINVNKLFG